MSESLISIIIPIHNRFNLVERAVNSVINQTYTNWELFLIDDCSDKHYNLQLTDKRIFLIRNEKNLGPGGSRQVGVNHAKGQFIVFLDSDDYLAESYLEKNLTLHRQDQTLAFTYCKSVIISDKTQSSTIYKSSHVSFSNILPTLLTNHRPWPTCALFWRAPLSAKWEKNISRWEDYLFEFEAGLINNTIQHINEVLCYIGADDENSLSAQAETKHGLGAYSQVLFKMLEKLESKSNLSTELIRKLRYHLFFRLAKLCIKVNTDFPDEALLLEKHLQKVKHKHSILYLLYIIQSQNIKPKKSRLSIFFLKVIRNICLKLSQ